MALSLSSSFVQFSSNLEITDIQTETVSTRQKRIRSVLNSDFNILDDFLTGSYSRKTMIAPLSKADIDIFIVLNSDYYHRYNGSNGGQAGLIDSIKNSLKKTYPKTPNISRNGQAVTITFDDFKVDVVPAFYRNGGGYIIPNALEQSWISTDPKAHIDIFSKSNKNHNQKLIPLIKMLKAWNRENDSFFNSFHLEVLALNIFNNTFIDSYPSAIYSFFDGAMDMLGQRLKDPAGYDNDIASYINNSFQKTEQAKARFKNAYLLAGKALTLSNEGYEVTSCENWRKLLGSSFPS